jgi:hypothetical protein
MNDRKQPIRHTPVDNSSRTSVRSVPEKKPGAPTDSKPTGRHPATTADLYSYRGYKTWIEKVRGTWEEKKK